MSGGVEVENNNSIMELWLLLECSQWRDSSGYHRGERKHYSQQSPSRPRNSPPQKWTEKKIVVNYFSLYMYSLYSMQPYIMPDARVSRNGIVQKQQQWSSELRTGDDITEECGQELGSSAAADGGTRCHHQPDSEPSRAAHEPSWWMKFYNHGGRPLLGL